MTKISTHARCRICGETKAGSGITRHLSTHLGKLAVDKPGSTFLHLKVSGGSFYFLHLLVPATLTFEKLDYFLRRIWLECCGHMSEFHYEWGNKVANSKQIGSVLGVKESIRYVYDFGSTTELVVAVVGKYSLTVNKKGNEEIIILSRNEAYEFLCTVCGEPADSICMECAGELENPFYCEECSEDEDKHSCGDEMLLPSVNSPRMGECAYMGIYDSDGFKLLQL